MLLTVIMYYMKVKEIKIIIRPYLKDMIDNHKARGEWKI